MNITLIGFMGTGKTVVGRRLAQRLGRRFVDVDRLIERQERRSVARIFRESGEPYFRRVECAAIARLARRTNLVIATGGGAVLEAANLAALKRNGVVIGLSASVRAILQRVGHNEDRPLLTNIDRRRRIVALLHARRPCYAQADLTIETTRRSIEEVVACIARYLARTPWPRSAFARTVQVWDLPRAFCRHARLLSRRYPGRYVAIVDDHVVAVGRSRQGVYRQALHEAPAPKAIGVVYVPQRAELDNVSPLWFGRPARSSQ